MLALALILADHLGRVLAHSHRELVFVIGRTIDLLGDLYIAAVVTLQAGQQDGIGRGLCGLVAELRDAWILDADVIENLLGNI